MEATAAVHAFRSLLERAGRRPQMNGNGSGKALCPCHDDHSPSLTFRPADRVPGVLAHCHVCQAGLKDVLERIGASPAERDAVMGRTASVAAPAQDFYVYHDAQGTPVFRVVRMAPREPGGKKSFIQQRPVGQGWVAGLTDPGTGRKVQVVPYRLPEALRAVQGGRELWFAEGEKDVASLVALGLEATCNPGGAGKWRPAFGSLFRGLARAVVCADNDEPGEAHALDVAASLAAAGVGDITVVHFPGPRGHDVTDWLERVDPARRLEALRAHVGEHGRPPEPPRPPAEPAAAPAGRPRVYPFTDMGNAERLVAAHGDDLRFVHAWGKWLLWNERLWMADVDGAVQRLAKLTVRGMYREAAGADDEQRKKLARHALQSESLRAANAMVTMAQSQVSIVPDQLDADAWLLNVENGTLELKSGRLREHRRSDLMTKLAPVTFEEGARHAVWERFLERMVPDAEVRAFLQRAAGYTLTGETTEENLFFIHGPTASGKSTFIAAMQAVLGDYASTCNFETFLQQDRGSSATTDLARLPGVRMAVSLEVDEGRKLAVGVLKSVTGRDAISARHLYQEAFTYRPAFKLWLVANDKPRADASDNAIWRRILLVPFEESLSAEERDPTVKTTLMNDPAARSAILAWALEGLRQWQLVGLKPAEAVLRATEGYRAEQDIIGDFLDECTIPDIHGRVSTSQLYKAYTDWCHANGDRPLMRVAMTKRLKHHGLTPIRNSTSRGWQGVRLKGAPEQTSAF